MRFLNRYLKPPLNKARVYGITQSFKFLFREILYRVWNQVFLGSYSQGREDLEIDKLLKFKKKGFYIDVGAGDPTRFNNTYRFYKRGWRGINIEPNVDSFYFLREKRKSDLNLNILISNSNKKSFFYEFETGTLSTTVNSVAEEYKKRGFKLVKKRRLQTKKLSWILAKYLSGKVIDFISVDAEGSDLEVLKSNDWKKFRPHVLCVEVPSKSIKFPVKSADKTAIIKFLENRGYEEYFDNGVNKIFADGYTLY